MEGGRGGGGQMEEGGEGREGRVVRMVACERWDVFCVTWPMNFSLTRDCGNGALYRFHL